MERFEIRTDTANAEDLVYVEAECFESNSSGGVSKAELRGDLYADRTLYIGYVETGELWRGGGVATRLLAHVIQVLGATRVTAQTVDERADALFAAVARSAPGVTFDID